MSKGSTQRPRSVAQEEYDTRWDAIFGRDQQEPTPPKCWGESPNIELRKNTTEFGAVDTKLTQASQA